MPVQIKDSVIKVTQRQPAGNKDKSASTSLLGEGVSAAAPKPADIDIIVDLCTERVFDKLKERFEP